MSKTMIPIKIQGQKFLLTYQEAKQLYYDVLDGMRNSPGDAEETKKVQQRLTDFELSSRQFPDELFYPKT